MSAIKIRNNSGEWIDPCTTAIRVMDSGAVWNPIKELDKVYTGVEWVHVMCTAPTTINASTNLPPVITNGGSILISGFLNGVQTGYLYDYLGGSMVFDIDKKLPIVFEWDIAIARIKVNGRIITVSPYTFIANNTLVLEILLN